MNTPTKPPPGSKPLSPETQREVDELKSIVSSAFKSGVWVGVGIGVGVTAGLALLAGPLIWGR